MKFRYVWIFLKKIRVNIWGKKAFGQPIIDAMDSCIKSPANINDALNGFILPLNAEIMNSVTQIYVVTCTF